MPRFAAIRDESIISVSDKKFASDDFIIIEIPSALNDVLPDDLINDWRYINGEFKSRFARKPSKQLKVAFVGNHQQVCGIATYNNKLFSEISKHINDYKLFIETNKNPIKPLTTFGDNTIHQDKIIECWERGKSLQELANQIIKYDPDIVLISHENGLFPSARYWLALMSRLSQYRVIVIMHSIYPYHKDKTVIESSIPEIIVHLDGAKEVLESGKQVAGKCYVIPHGCDPCLNKERLWNIYGTNHTIVQFGFGFSYHGYDQSIRAIALLKQKYDDVFFTALISESPFNKSGHQKYYNALIKLINELGLHDNVAILRGFQSETVLDSFLRVNKIAIFPYTQVKEHQVFGSSGSIRHTMSKHIPVISSNGNHFLDIPSIKADGPKEIAEAVERLFENNELVKTQLNVQNKWLEDNSWCNIALRYVKIFESK